MAIFLAITFSAFDDRSLIRFQTTQTASVAVIEKNILAINSEGDGRTLQSDSFVFQTTFKKRKKFDITFHRRLEQHFPDWVERIDYQKKQEEFYKLAMRRKRELKKLKIKENSTYYTNEELDAIQYFQGTGFYQKQQDPKLKPNIFDPRQTFLLKMHNPVLRNNCLNSLNSCYVVPDYLKFPNGKASCS